MADRSSAPRDAGVAGHHAAAYTVKTTLVLTGVSATCLARYERAQIVKPARVGRRRLYREDDVRRLRKARRLESDLGLNLPGVQVVLRLTEQLEALQRRLVQYEGRSESDN
jgi:MerR family transcriptional regulator, heat shock protein HspR